MRVFQTEPVLFLQGLACGPLTSFMRGISFMGGPLFCLGIPWIILLCVSFRKGFWLLHVTLCTAISTDILKELIALPRPERVDSAVQRLEAGKANPTPLRDSGSHTFFGLPEEAAIDDVRAQKHPSYGFPSGHVSLTVAFWGGLCLFLSRRFIAPGLVLTLLMCVSRLYLGKHFLADVIGGLLLGALVVGVAARVRGRAGCQAHWIRWVYMVALPAALLLGGLVNPLLSGQLLGANCAYMVVDLMVMPSTPDLIRHKTP